MKSLSILLTLITTIYADDILDSFQCFDSPKVITYMNSADVVPDLPQVRIMMCGYSSQCALNMVAYLFMKEKLGMNVTLYPTSDYDQIWNATYWSSDPTAADPVLDQYPRNYFEWLANDDMDLNFEFWTTQLEAVDSNGEMTFDGKTEYVLSGKIDFGGFVGAYAEESIWIPRYWAEAHPENLVPYVIKNNATFRTALIDAAANGGSIDYIAEYASATGFGTPDYSTPTVWGSDPDMFMSTYANDLLQNVQDGLDLNFVTIGDEDLLFELVNDLYSQRLPFFANIYTIDNNFAVFENETTEELRQYEKIAFARNPDQSAYTPCFLARKCQYPVSPIMKAANPLLQTRYPEAYEFFTGFNVGARELNKIVSYYLVANQSISSTQQWLEAACRWLKSEDEMSIGTWNNSAWLTYVQKYDCLEGCGFNVGGDTVIGGTCDYITGECVCDRDELFSDLYCQDSCPGMLGPFSNESSAALQYNLTNATNDGYYFVWCSGRGECDTTTRKCSCDLGYGDEGCSTKYSVYKLSTGLQVIIILLSVILAIVCVGCIVWLRMNKHYKTVKALSVDMTTIMTVGLLMITCSNVALTLPINSVTCIAWQWCFGLGGILAIMSPLLKAYRVSRVFHGGKMLRAVKITDKMLMAMLIKCAVIEVLICIGYSILHEIFEGTTLYYNDDELRIEEQCNDDSFTNYVAMGSYAYFFVMLCALTKYSYGTRRALSVFKESTCAYFSSFLSLFCTLIVLVFSMASADPTFNIAVQSFAIILVVSAALVLFYGTRIYGFYAEPENRNVTDARQTMSHSTTGFSNSVMKQPSST